MKLKEIEPSKKISHPISVYSKDPHFVSAITSANKEYFAELPAKALIVRIDEETFEEIKYFWDNFCAAILKYNDGQIIHGNIVINAKCSVDCEECF